MSRDCRYLEAILHHDIPLTRAMQVKVIAWENYELRLKCPLEVNINHQGSMFGGSLYCAAVLAGWGWLHLRLRELNIGDGQIVIKQGKIDYDLPMVEDALAVCGPPSDADWAKFMTLYRRRGLARLALNTRVLTSAGEDAVHFSGQFVLYR